MNTEKTKPAAKKLVNGAGMDERLRTDLEVEHTLGWLFIDIHRLLSKNFEGRIKSLGLTRAQWRVLMCLKRSEDGITQTELADVAETEKAPLGKILDRLEEDR